MIWCPIYGMYRPIVCYESGATGYTSEYYDEISMIVCLEEIEESSDVTFKS